MNFLRQFLILIPSLVIGSTVFADAANPLFSGQCIVQQLIEGHNGPTAGQEFILQLQGSSFTTGQIRFDRLGGFPVDYFANVLIFRDVTGSHITLEFFRSRTGIGSLRKRDSSMTSAKSVMPGDKLALSYKFSEATFDVVVRCDGEIN